MRACAWGVGVGCWGWGAWGGGGCSYGQYGQAGPGQAQEFVAAYDAHNSKAELLNLTVSYNDTTQAPLSFSLSQSIYLLYFSVLVCYQLICPSLSAAAISGSFANAI